MSAVRNPFGRSVSELLLYVAAAPDWPRHSRVPSAEARPRLRGRGEESLSAEAAGAIEDGELESGSTPGPGASRHATRVSLVDMDGRCALRATFALQARPLHFDPR